MPKIRNSRQSPVVKRELATQKRIQREIDERRIVEVAAYTEQLRVLNCEDKKRQIRLLKRIKRRIPSELLLVIYEYLTEPTVKYLTSLVEYKVKREYSQMMDKYITFIQWTDYFQATFRYISEHCCMSRLITKIPVRMLERFTQSSIATSCYGLIMDKWSDVTDLYNKCITYNSNSYDILNHDDYWIYKSQFGRIITKLHLKIERGDLTLIPLTRRLIKAIEYLSNK